MSANQILPANTHIGSVVNDAPIRDPKDDQLQRGEFSNQLADAILRMDASEGFVIALNGPWGSGKTSVINLVRHRLREAVREKRLVVTEFKPWWFSGQEQLIKQYFRHLWTVFNKKNVPEGLQKIGDAFESIGNIFEKLSNLPNVPGTAGWGSKIFGALSYVFSSTARARQMDLDAWRDKVIAQLSGQGARVVVIIDDIDRLAVAEMRQMFQVVKAVGNFPNTIYLLSFDTLIVEKAVETDQSGSGRAYLEKIVQLPFDLPQPDSPTLHRLFFSQLDKILEGTPDVLWKSGDWTTLFWESISPYLKSIRDVKRLLNRLRATYPLVKGEVNGPEFVAFQTLYLFEPALVEYIRDNKESFTGALQDFKRGVIPDKSAKAEKEKLLEELRLSNRTVVDETLQHLFPRWAARTGQGGGYSNDWSHQWRKDRRVRHPDVFPLYFNLQVPIGDISSPEMNEILSSAPDPSSFSSHLLRLAAEKTPNGLTRVHAFLDKIQDYTEERIPEDHIVPILKALFNVGDKLFIETDTTGFAMFDNPILILRVINQLTKRLKTQQERFEAIKQGIEDGKSLYTIVHEIGVQGQEHGKFKNTEQLDAEPSRSLSAVHLAALETIALEKIRASAADGSLLHAPRLILILYSWKEWAGLNEPKAFISRLADDDSSFVALVKGVSGKGRSTSATEVREWTTVNPDTLVEFMGLTKDELARRASDILASQTLFLGEKQREVLKVLIDNIRKPKNSFGEFICAEQG